MIGNAVGNVFDGITFRLNGMVFAVDALKIRVVVGGAEWTQDEGGRQNSIQVRGRVMRVVDLRNLFGFSSLEKKGINSFLAIQVHGQDRNQLAALWVDSLLEMIHVPSDEFKNLTEILVEGIPGRFIQSVLEKDGEKIYMIQIDEIIREELSTDKQLDRAVS